MVAYLLIAIAICILSLTKCYIGCIKRLEAGNLFYNRCQLYRCRKASLCVRQTFLQLCSWAADWTWPDHRRYERLIRCPFVRCETKSSEYNSATFWPYSSIFFASISIEADLISRRTTSLSFMQWFSMRPLSGSIGILAGHADVSLPGACVWSSIYTASLVENGTSTCVLFLDVSSEVVGGLECGWEATHRWNYVIQPGCRGVHRSVNVKNPQ